MITTNIDQITEEDLQALINNAISEGKTIEYKQSLPGNSDADKKEFVADISSFANASGGDLIFGILEDRDTGLPVTLEGLTIANVDQEIIRLDSIIRDGIEPRIIGIVIKPVKLSNSKTAIVIRVPKSWISPHRVSFKGHDKFYSRSTNGKYPMDVAELRIAFNLSETVTERIRKFREDRISKIYANETPVPFNDTAKIVLHLIPIISFHPGQSYEINKIALHPEQMRPILYPIFVHHRYNLDGFLTFDSEEQEKSSSYVQLFKNGIIEAVEGHLLDPAFNQGKLWIPISSFEKSLIQSLSEYLSVLQTLNVELPVFIFMSLLGVKGYSKDDFHSHLLRSPYPIDRNVLMLPEIVIESYDVRAQDVLRPCFDSIWNACGFPRSLNYNEAGEWVGR
ncbi:MAG TPA: ATP-binding protein [Bacteroidota bacterium]|nr:ATP-binding protein [Bacteroidota bacterium]